MRPALPCRAVGTSPSRPRRGLGAALAGLLAAAVLLPGAPAVADPPPGGPAAQDRYTALGPAEPVVLRRDPAPQREVSVVPAPTRSQSTGGGARATGRASEWSVTFSGPWPSAARTAFNAAVETWAQLLVSPSLIKVNATWGPIDPDPRLLGYAAPNVVLDNRSGIVYPEALINSIAREDLDTSEPEIVAFFNSNATSVYFGTDGRPATGQVDFRTIVLHELGHGLGFASETGPDPQGRGYWGIDFFGDGRRRPLSYDRHVVARETTGTRAITSYPQGITELTRALTGGQLFWDGAKGKQALGGARPQLYAPSPFEDGSSYAHLDEAAFPRGNPHSLMTPFVGNGEVIHDPGAVALGILADQGWVVPVDVGSRYTALDPVRVLQTSTGAPVRIGAGGTTDLRVAGVHGVPADATAVVLNVTGVAPTAATDVRVYPRPVLGTAFPEVSNLNLAAGHTRANLVTVPVGSGGSVRLRNAGGSVGLLADLAGFYSPGAASTYTALDPVRLLDTREGLGARTGRVGPGETVDLQVTGGPVPAGASAVVLNVTAAQASAPTDVRVYPTPTGDGAPPVVSNLNTRVGPPVPNLVTVKLSPDGRVRLRNNSGSLHLIADVSGYYSSDPAGSLFRPVGPTRILDTRSRLGTSGSAPTRVGTRGQLDLTVGGVARIPITATSVVLNVTGVSATALTDVRVFPRPASGSFVPEVSTLNLGRGQTAANLAVVKVGAASQVRFFNSSGDVALVADAAGWFGPAS